MITPLPRKRVAAALLLSMLAGGAFLLHRTPSWAADPPNVVNSVADGGPNTLRDAILYANAHPGTTIQFKIPVLPPGEIAHTISPLSPLPTITAAGTIFDGASQTLLTGDSNPAGPEIVLNGSFGGAFSSGLNIAASNCVVKGLIINGWNVAGVRITGASTSGVIVRSCFLGTDELGTLAFGNVQGVQINQGADNCIIGGTSGGQGNLIAGNFGAGIDISGDGTTGHQIQGNYIGTDVAGTSALSNGVGVRLQGKASVNTIGGGSIGARNVISGNSNEGVRITGSGTNSNKVQGNYIGVTIDGDSPVPNGTYGVLINSGAQLNLIGGASAGYRNVISGNKASGVGVTGAATNSNLVQGNYIGIDSAATEAVPNLLSGVLISSCGSNTVGGTVAGARNVISGNAQSGVVVSGAGAEGNQIQGNYIGTNASATAALPNLDHGVYLKQGAKGTLIGGDGSGFRNVISGNKKQGILLTDAATADTLIQGNYIGLNASGNAAVPNVGMGIYHQNAANTIIGGLTAGKRNIISGNGMDGIYLRLCIGTLVQGNRLGTNAGGTAAVPNAEDGCRVAQAQSCIIGGADPAAGNLISGNGVYGVGLINFDTDANQVLNNRIGTNATGTSALPNGKAGVTITHAAMGNLIGAAGAGNQISGNNGPGVAIDGTEAANNRIQANLIGTNATGLGALPNTGDGVVIKSADHNFVGGTLSSLRNIISGNGGNGVFLQYSDCTANQILGNYIGTNVTGTAALPNKQNGVLFQGEAAGPTGNAIGGFAGARNVISGNLHDGIRFTPRGSNFNIVRGNYIGLNAAGDAGIPNGMSGVAMRCAGVGVAGNLVASNVISANKEAGIFASGPIDSTEVSANLIGTDASGSIALGNGGPGIWIFGKVGIEIGGNSSLDRNVISGNKTQGILLDASTGVVTISANHIGTDETGLAALPNLAEGIKLTPGTNGVAIGGSAAGFRNVISGNTGSGVRLIGPSTYGNLIAANYIGADSNGSAALGNGADGVRIEGGATQNVVGGTAVGARNVISGNAANGVQLRGAGTGGNLVRGNTIGANAARDAGIPNGSAGVLVSLGASQNSIGGPGAAYGNVIAFNDDDGVLIRDTASTGNMIRANSIHTNGGLGINLEATGTVGVITLNDNGDGDNGPNALQNFPTITQIATSAGNTLVSVRLLNAEPNTAYTLELFRSVTPDPSGNGEGEVYVGVASVTTNASGNASVTMTVTGTFLGQSYAATSTKSSTNSTSEFGPAVTHN